MHPSTRPSALITAERFKTAGFAAPLGLNDIRLVLATAEELRVPMPLASLLRDRFLTLLAKRGDKLDWTAIGRLRPYARLPPV